MKIFIYKLLIFFILSFIFFQFTIGYTIRNYENKILNTFSKDKIFYLRDKLKDEIKSSLKEEQILSNDDALLLKNFFKKINNEIENSK
jgi:hypothetical protein|tara:strand:+ start:522 stop:785 length:264 start_codon:yes stop_codon:yes gene_type:complete